MNAGRYVWLLIGVLGCTPTKSAGLLSHTPAASSAKLQPVPPRGLFWLKLSGAEIPDKTAGGQLWDEADELPDPFAVIYVDGHEVMRGSTESNSLAPTWPDGPSGNIELPPGSAFRVDVFDADVLEDTLIGRGKFSSPTSDELAEGFMWVELKAASGGGALARRGRVKLSVSAPHALIGFGFGIEVDRNRVFVAECLEQGPAGRAGMRKGDRIIAVNGTHIEPATESEGRAFFEGATKLDLTVKHGKGPTQTLMLERSAVYPLFHEHDVLP